MVGLSWLVVVSQPWQATLYGPFRTKKGAEQFKLEHADTFTKATVHVVPTRPIPLMPDEEAGLLERAK